MDVYKLSPTVVSVASHNLKLFANNGRSLLPTERHFFITKPLLCNILCVNAAITKKTSEAN
ncbi:hypothetical protein NC652_012294 [Populus alba x Populus x berolinensis]|nr:hypothetical protein NC652_012294 [Populus alba x Populus x berolinensis]